MPCSVDVVVMNDELLLMLLLLNAAGRDFELSSQTIPTIDLSFLRF